MKLSWLFNIEPLWGLTNIDSFVAKVSSASAKNNTVVWTVLWEQFTVENNRLLELVKATRRANPSTKIIVLISRWLNKNSFLAQGVDVVVPIDFFTFAVRSRIEHLNNGRTVTSWNPDKKNFLFLTGKPEKLNRVRLLWKLDRAGLLEHAHWSFFMTDELREQCHKLLPELSREEFDAFVQQRVGSPDKVQPRKQIKSLHYPGVPFDVGVYENNLFQLISETQFSPESDRTLKGLRPCISEKTLLSILNHRPFIIAGIPGYLAELRDNYGFRTFNSYLPNADYDSIRDPEARLDAIVENTAYWLENIQKQSMQISMDVRYNYNRMLELSSENLKILTTLLNDNNLPGTWQDVVAEADDYQQQTSFRTWYENVRDASWPDCANEDEWHSLPDTIKRECVEVFGYNPTVKDST